MTNNIALIGFMGCGKTVIGRELASVLNARFFDTDEVIVSSAGLPIADIFDKYGEPYFRELEKKALELVIQGLNIGRCVISLGGGIVKSEANMLLLKAHAKTVYLKASPERIYKNTKHDVTRPLLNTENRFETIVSLLSVREPLYERYADVIINIGEVNTTVAHTAEKIVRAINVG